MKKIICFLTAAVLTVSMAMPAFAASSKVTIKNNTSSKPVTYTYDSEDKGENVKSIKSLMTKLSEVTKSKMRTQTLTVTSDSADGSPVSFKLRISIPTSVKKPASSYYTALDYYKLKVNAENGTLLYSYEDEPESADEDEDYRDIPLGVLNKSKTNESAVYNIAISVNNDIKDSSVASAAKNLDWSIVSEPYKEPEETASPEPEETASPEPSPSALPSASPSPQPTAKARSDKNGIYTLEKGEYTVGTDVDPDKYTMTGSGLVNTYDADGKLERTVALKAKDDKSSNGVTEYVINLSKGEKLDIDNSVKLEPYVQPTASPTPSPTPKASSSSSSSGSSSKSNPKTGDSAPIAGVSVLGIAALAGATFITLRKKNK